MTTDTAGRGLEKLVCKVLAGTTCEPRAAWLQRNSLLSGVASPTSKNHLNQISLILPGLCSSAGVPGQVLTLP